MDDLFTSDGTYSFRGPRTAISCTVDWDADRECYIARGSGFVGTGPTADMAALNCFRAWSGPADHAWYEGGA